MSTYIIANWRGKLVWQRIGEASVDSGQLLIVDPCYLEKWRHGESEDSAKPPNHYAETFSATMGANRAGQVFDDAAVAVATAHGDGSYPVYVQRNQYGGISKVLIDFEHDMEDEEGE